MLDFAPVRSFGLMAVIVIRCGLGGLLVLADASAIAPLIYTLF
jgi:hypothetical protein